MMKHLRKSRLSTILTACVIAIAMMTLWAQEPRMENRGISVTQGNVIISRGYLFDGGGIVRDYRTASAIATAGAGTYTAAQVMTGWIQRTPGVGGNVTDALPTAALLAAAVPNAAAGYSFWIVHDMGASPGGTATINGAATGVTYAGGCGTAVGTGDVTLILISFTSATAYTATCLNVNT